MNINLLNSAIGWVIGLGVVVVLIAVILALLPIKYWFRCLVSGTYLPMSKLFGMKLRGVNLSIIIDSYINANEKELKRLDRTNKLSLIILYISNYFLLENKTCFSSFVNLMVSSLGIIIHLLLMQHLLIT